MTFTFVTREMASSASSSSSMPPPVVKDEETISWSDLPPEITSSIMGRLGAYDILENAQKVCRPWRRLSMDPSLWRKIDLRNLGRRIREDNFGEIWEIADTNYYLDRMCRNAVDRSEGGLVEIYIERFGTDSLLTYIADRFLSSPKCFK